MDFNKWHPGNFCLSQIVLMFLTRLKNLLLVAKCRVKPNCETEPGFFIIEGRNSVLLLYFFPEFYFSKMSIGQLAFQNT